MSSTRRVPVESSGELRQKSQIVFEEQTNVVDAVLEHGDALDAETERESREAVRVVPHLLEHRGVHHAGAAHLDESGPLAPAASRAAAEDAGDVVFRPGLHEGEVRA